MFDDRLICLMTVKVLTVEMSRREGVTHRVLLLWPGQGIDRPGLVALSLAHLKVMTQN